MFDAEALLLVDDDQAELLEGDGAGQQGMCADDQVDLARGQPSLDLLGLLRRREARERADAHGEARVALGESLRVLGDQQSRGHEDGGLVAVLDGLEGGAHGDLGLAVADVAGEQAVHGNGLFHVGLDLVDGDELVGGLHVGEGILEFALPGRVGPEGVSLGLLAHGVQADELLGDLVDGLLRARLGLRPVRAAHLRQGRLVGSGVLRDLVQGVGGHEEPVGGLAALGGRVLDHQVVARGGGVPAPDRARDQLDEAPDAVLVVDNVVPGVQGQRVDTLAPARGHAPHVARGGADAPGQVAFGEDREFQVGRDESDAGLRGRDGDEAGVGARFHAVRERGRARGVGEDGADASAGAGAFGGDDDAPAVAGQVGEVGGGAGEVPAVGVHVAGSHAHEGGRDDDGRRASLTRGPGLGLVDGGGEVGGRQVGELPPGARPAPPQLAQVEERGLGGLEGSVGSPGGGAPRGGEELLGGGDQVGGAGADAFGVGGEDGGACREQVKEGFHAAHEDGGQRFDAGGCDSLGGEAEHLGGAGQAVGGLAGAGTHRLGEEEFAAGDGPQAVGGLAEGALVGDGEGTNVVDLVAPQLHAQRVGFLGREHVEDAAAHAHLAASFDHVDALVAKLGQPVRHIGEVHDVAGAHTHGFEVRQAGDDRLEEGADGHDEDRDRARAVVALDGVDEAAQDGDAARHRVDLGRETLVGQGLPRGQHSHARDPRGQGVRQRLRVAPGGREDHERRGRAGGHGREERRPDADGGDDHSRAAGLDGVRGRLDRGIGGDVREESGK